MAKKILIDLDVVTVAFWDKNKDAESFLERVKSGELEVVTPYILLDLLSKWKHDKLSEKLTHFYELYSSEVLSAQKVFDKINKLQVNGEEITNELIKKGVKEEDIVLVIVTSIFDIDYLITYNRKHLRNKEEIINDVLEKMGLKTIKIALPSEI